MENERKLKMEGSLEYEVGEEAGIKNSTVGR